MSALERLQGAIKDGNEDIVKKVRLRNLYASEVSDDVYGTLALITDPGDMNEHLQMLDPDDLLIEAVEETIGRGADFFQLAGLALKNGAKPNLYVTTEFVNEQGLSQLTVIHIIAYAWRVYFERGTDYSMLVKLIALLCAAGSDARLPVTDREVLLERLRGMADDPRSVGASQVIEKAGKPTSVMKYISDNREEGGVLEDASEVYLSDMALKYIAVFTAFKGTLSDIGTALQDDYFTAGELQLEVPIRDEDVNIATSLAEEVGEYIDDISHMKGDEGDDKLSRCMSIHANRCATLLLAGDSISELGAEEAFLQALEAYNGKGIRILLEAGFRPRYNHVDRLIFMAALKNEEELPISCEILNGMMVICAEMAVCFDHQQLGEVGVFSEPTFLKLSEIEMIPYWQRTCSAPNGYVRSDLRALARELDLDPELSKDKLCQEFTKIASVTTESLSKASKKLQTEKLVKGDKKLGGLVDQTDQPVCVNEKMLTRDVSTYSKLDLHRIQDLKTGDFYCFEAVEYPLILRTGVNKYTDSKIGRSDLGAIRGKLDTLTALALPLESDGIERAIEKLKAPANPEDYEIWVRARRDKFIRTVANTKVGIDQNLFLNEVDEGGLTVRTMEQILQQVTGRKDFILTPMNNRESALRSFALTMMEYIDEAKSLEYPASDDALRGIFRNLRSAVKAFTRAN